MKVLVDADACPVVGEIIDLVDEREIILVHNRHHRIDRSEDYVTTIEAGDRQDAADHRIYSETAPGDIVVTDDLGLAALVLGKEASVIRFRGDRVDEENIDMKLALRHASARARRARKRMKGPPPFTDEDRRAFREALKALLE